MILRASLVPRALATALCASGKTVSLRSATARIIRFFSTAALTAFWPALLGILAMRSSSSAYRVSLSANRVRKAPQSALSVTEKESSSPGVACAELSIPREMVSASSAPWDAQHALEKLTITVYLVRKPIFISISPAIHPVPQAITKTT